MVWNWQGGPRRGHLRWGDVETVADGDWNQRWRSFWLRLDVTWSFHCFVVIDAWNPAWTWHFSADRTLQLLMSIYILYHSHVTRRKMSIKFNSQVIWEKCADVCSVEVCTIQLHLSPGGCSGAMGGGSSKGTSNWTASPFRKPPALPLSLRARCLTLTGAGDERSLWQPVEVNDSWEPQPRAAEVSIFKAHQLQWEWTRTARTPSREGGGNFNAVMLRPPAQTNTDAHCGRPLCKEA